MPGKKALYLILILLLAGRALFAQEGEKVPRRLYLYVVGEAGVSPKMERVLAESLILMIGRYTSIVVVESDRERILPAGDEQKSELARDLGADSWLEVSVRVQGRGTLIRSRLYDINTRQLVFEKEVEKARAVEQPDNGFWQELLGDLRQALTPMSQRVVVEKEVRRVEEVKVVEHVRGAEVTVEAVPGSKVKGLGKHSLLVDESGSVTAEVPQRATYKVRVRHWRYQPERETIYVGSGPKAISIDQAPSHRFGLETYLDFDSFFGIGAYYFLIPNYGYASFRIENSLFMPFPPFINREEHYWFARNLVFRLSLGSYLLPQDFPVRVAVSAGGFLRFFMPKGEPIVFHPIHSLGGTLGLLFEVPITRQLRFFLEWFPDFYLYVPLELAGRYDEYYDKFEGPWDDTDLSGPVRAKFSNMHLGVRYQF